MLKYKVYIKGIIQLEKRVKYWYQGVTKRCRRSWLTNSALVYEPKCGGRGELRGISQWVQQYTGVEINFGDLTPYLTYDWYHSDRLDFVHKRQCSFRSIYIGLSLFKSQETNFSILDQKRGRMFQCGKQSEPRGSLAAQPCT